MKSLNALPAWLKSALATAAALLVVTLTITYNGGDNTISITVQGPAGPTTVATTPEAVEEAKAENTHEDSRDESPTTATSAQLTTAQKQQAAFAAKDQLPTSIPLAAPSQRGCRTRMIGNKSSRNGVKPRLLVPHYTVSPNRTGFEDVNAITQLFDRRAFAASSTYVIDRDGNCNYIVREAEKPWTQATFNPVSISWEIINTGSERPLFTNAGLAKMAMIMSDSARRWGIPIRKAIVRGCSVVRSGIIDHFGLGACGGGHVDITPFNIDQIIAAIQKHRAGASASFRYPNVAHFGRKRQIWCKRLAVVRKNAKVDKWTPRRVSAAERYKSLIGSGQFKCKFTT